MQFIVVDVECFTDNIIKELSIVSPFFAVGFSFAPPIPLSEVPLAKQKANNWLTRNLHGITWESGVVPYGTLSNIVAVFDNPNLNVYVKGLTKLQTLKEYFPKANLINLEQIQCPKYAELAKFTRFMEVSCSSYPQTHNSATFGQHCAQRNASMYCQ